MLPKNQRLNSTQFTQVFEQGRKTHSQYIMLVQLDSDAEQTQVSCAVSKKVSRQAVGRNRLRRRMYAVLRDLYRQLQPGKHVVLIAKKGIDQLDAQQLQQTITQVLASAKLLRNNNGAAG